MAILDKNGKLFGRINVIDFTTGVVLVLVAVGVMMVQSGKLVTSGKMVEGETDILISVEIPNLKSLDTQLFVPGHKTAITIRNQPRGDVLIESAKVEPVKITLLSSAGKPEAYDDVAQQNSNDYFVTLKDHAKITTDGYVAEGVKVKIGLPIELEGLNYRVYGKLIDVKPLTK